MKKTRIFLFVLIITMSIGLWSQGTESFTNLPTTSASSYLSRSWTGDDGVTWTAEGARTDQTITGKAICFGNSGTRNVISPTYANGMGTLTFNYVRGFTSTSARSLEVYVNSSQIGSTITVSPTSDAVVQYNNAINVSGNVVLEIRSTGSAQVKVDDIVWTSNTTTPTISVTGSLSAFSTFTGTPSASQSYTLSGANLTANINVAALAGFEYSTTDADPWTSTLSLASTYDGLVYVRLTGSSAGSYSGNIAHTSTGATQVDLPASGTVTDPAPTVYVSTDALNGFMYIVDNGPSDEQSFTVSGVYLTGDIDLTASADYEISETSGSGFSGSITLYQAKGDIPETTIYVRLIAGLSSGDYNDEDITVSSTDVDDQTITCSGSVAEPADNLFFSEYIEGSSNNKALEIYNASGVAVDLSRYQVLVYSNGSSTASYTLNMTGTLAAGEVYVIGNSSAIQAILDESDVLSSVTYYNGDDAVALHCTNPDVNLDIIGVIGTDPGTAWDVAGTANATAEHTLVRKPAITQGNTDWSSSAGTGASDSEWIVYAQDYIDNLGSHTFGTQYVETPTFDPAGGNYYTSQSVEINCATSGATIHYSTDSETGPWTDYTVAISVTSTTTIWAYASKTDMDDSPVTSVTYTLPIDVANIAALRASSTGSALYRLTGEAVLTLQTSTRNAKYIQDATGAVLIDDPSGNITTSYNLGDGITGIIGTLGFYANMLQFTPATDPGTATSTGNVITPEAVTLLALDTSYQGKLVKILNVSFAARAIFAASTTYDISDLTGSGVVRTQYADLDYIGETIPTTPKDITGVILQYNTTMQFVPRSWAEFEDGGTVPVELSSFTAVVTAENFVAIHWTTQSETNVQGYYLYRNTFNELNNAYRIPAMISATNTSQEASYTFVDQEVVPGTYYYWLQNLDLNGEFDFHGPINVTLTQGNGGDTPPVIPTETALLAAYPNPFNPITNLRYSLKNPGFVTIDVYNNRGQLIRHFGMDHPVAGYYKVVWDGKDTNGREVSSGIYYYRMNSGKYTSSKKVVLLK